MRKQQEFKTDSEDLIKKMRADFEAGYSGLGDAFEEERRKQLEELERGLKDRAAEVKAYKQARKEEEERKRVEALEAEERKHEEVRILRKKRDEMEKVVIER